MQANRDRVILLVWHEGDPVHNLRYTLKVVVGRHVRDTILVHDLGTTQLQVRSVNLTTEKFVDSCGSCEDDRLALNLDSTLPKAD